MKRRCRAIEVALPGVDGGRLFDGCQATSLLAEVEYAELVGDEVQASEEEGLGWLENKWNLHPRRRECGILRRAKANRIARARHGGVAEKWAIRLPKSVERIASSPRTAPTVGAECDQLVNICSFAVRCDRRWPST